jgi:hypothetical protein
MVAWLICLKCLIQHLLSRPSYQTDIQTNAKRGVPDLSANADPKTVFSVCFTKTSSFQCFKIGGKNPKNNVNYFFFFFNFIFSRTLKEHRP